MNSDSDSPLSSGGRASQLAVSDVFDLIADSRRRLVLAILLDERGAVDEATLAGRVGEYESRLDGDDPPDAHLELRHRHLPKLDVHGVLEYDHEEGVVDRGPTFEEMRSHLERLDALPKLETVADT